MTRKMFERAMKYAQAPPLTDHTLDMDHVADGVTERAMGGLDLASKMMMGETDEGRTDRMDDDEYGLALDDDEGLEWEL